MLVDTPLISMQAMDWRRQIEEEYPDTQFLRLINTDHHRGHALGNQYFLPVRAGPDERAYKGICRVTPKTSRSGCDSFKREPEIQSQLNNIIIVPPDITFTQCGELLYGGRHIELILTLAATRRRPASSGCRRKRSASSATLCGWISTRTWRRATRWNGCAPEFVRGCRLNTWCQEHGPVVGPDSTVRVGEYIEFMRGRVRVTTVGARTKNQTKSGLVGEMLEWFPAPPNARPRLKARSSSGS